MNAVTVTNLSKAYKQYHRPWARLAEWVLPGTRPRHSRHWVLQGVNFHVRSGEAVGIVGINGAGKSTLLKIITGTAQPTTGRVEINGRVAALLELGMGFHPEFTGRQNVFMAGQLLGYSIEEIGGRMADIEAFAEIGDYIDQPVRVYSSGMQMRLAFSVATANRPDLLIVDEALAVGDAYFQHKCMLRIRDFKTSGTTLLFVSHADEAVRMLCDRALLLEDGRIVKDAGAAEVMDYYRAGQVRRCEADEDRQALTIQEHKPEQARAGKTTLSRETLGGIHAKVTGTEPIIRSGDRVSVCIGATLEEDCADPHIGFGVRTRMGIVVYEANTYTLGRRTRPVKSGETLEVDFHFNCALYPGTYELMVGVADGGFGTGSFERAFFFDQAFLIFEVLPGRENGWQGIWDLCPEVSVH